MHTLKKEVREAGGGFLARSWNCGKATCAKILIYLNAHMMSLLLVVSISYILTRLQNCRLLEGIVLLNRMASHHVHNKEEISAAKGASTL